MTQNKKGYALFITNLDTDNTFGLPVSIEELTKILKGIALLDNRKGTYFDGVVGEYEPYFEGITSNNETPTN